MPRGLHEGEHATAMIVTQSRFTAAFVIGWLAHPVVPVSRQCEPDMSQLTHRGGRATACGVQLGKLQHREKACATTSTGN